jgi:hypothetical protein
MPSCFLSMRDLRYSGHNPNLTWNLTTSIQQRSWGNGVPAHGSHKVYDLAACGFGARAIGDMFKSGDGILLVMASQTNLAACIAAG